MKCEEFEDHLTDYLDGFLPAKVFHSWERHAVLCGECSDLPGTVVRSIAACVNYKLDELELPAGLNQRILDATLGDTSVAAKVSVAARVRDWLNGLQLPVSVPQLAPVAMMLVFAVLVFTQTVSSDGSIAGIYSKSYELAEETYRQGAVAMSGGAQDESAPGDPVTGTRFASEESGK